MKHVLIKHTSETTFKTLELAQASVDWINTNLRKPNRKPDPRNPQFLEVDAGWKSVVYVTPEHPVEVEELDDMETLRKRYPIFDNQEFIVNDDVEIHPNTI